ncbi:MAG: TPM domain-containing protein [Erysipelotrichaceae bacterium]|nr:TPM domain-containing protein [Erysipelotrichaceae bacterium]
MKKIIKVLLISLMMLLVSQNVLAAGTHVIINTSENVVSDEQLRLLEDDLIHIEQDYDISIYVVYDETIDDSRLEDYTNQFINRYFTSANNVGLFINSSYYSIMASGSASDKVLANSESLWNDFLNYAVNANSAEDENLYKGIVAFYQGCVKLINGEVYQSNVPGVTVVTPYVNDYADLLSSDEEQELNRKLLAFKNRYGLDAVIVTTRSTNGMDIDDYADDFYDYNGYGKDGILLIIDMSDRSWYVSTKGKGITYFTDYGIDRIMDDMMPSLSNGRYYAAFDTFADDVESYTRSALDGDIIDYHEPKRGFGMGNVLVSAVVGLFASLIAMGILKSQLRSVSRQRFATNYIVDNSFMLTGASDLFVNRHVTRSRRPEPTRSSGGGGYSGGSSTHTSSSGSTHGGHGGHF